MISTLTNYKNSSIETYRNYLPPLTKRDDFTTFWNEQIEICNRTPLSSEFTEFPYFLPGVTCYHFNCTGIDETLLKGFFLVPKKRVGKVPLLIYFHGFNGTKGYPSDYSVYLSMGIAVAAIDVREQPGETGGNGWVSNGYTNNLYCKGILNKYEYYARYIYTDALRVLNSLVPRDEVDINKIVLKGGSQGGALVVALSALSDIPLLTICDVPSMSNLEARVLGENGSMSAVSEYLRKKPGAVEQVCETLSYFDTMNMANNIQAEIFASVGMKDVVCPPLHFYATYNRIVSSKQIEHYMFNGHEGGGAIHEQKSLAFLAQKLKIN